MLSEPHLRRPDACPVQPSLDHVEDAKDGSIRLALDPDVDLTPIRPKGDTLAAEDGSQPLGQHRSCSQPPAG